MAQDLELTPEQEEELLKCWNETPNNPPSLQDLTIRIFKEEKDGRTAEGRAIKRCLARHNLKAKTTTEYEKINFELTEDQKLYIDNHCQTSGIVDMARDIFKNPNLTNLNIETRKVAEYVKELDKDIVFTKQAEIEEVPEGDYEPPKTLDKVLRRANLYLNFILDKDKLTPTQKKGMEALLNYLHTYRFIKQINIYDSQTDRRSFEDAFIRYTYDKPGLSQEEVDQYIVLANEVVIAFKAQKRSEKLQQMLEQITDNNPDNARIAMSLVEAIGKAQSELNLSIKRQQDLLDDLTEKRSDKLSKRIQENSSILNILEAFKNEESRRNWMKLAEIEQKQIKEEVEKIESMSDIKARLLGFSKEEATNG